jgi:membrane glycosyltransferase
MAGFLLLMFGDRRYAISRSAAGTVPIRARRTAIVVPICNENAACSPVCATYESLPRTGDLGHFDFFVPSDDNPDARVAEIDAWPTTCRAVDIRPPVYHGANTGSRRKA